MSDEHKIQSLTKSVVSTILRLRSAMLSDPTITKSDDLRVTVREKVMALLEEIQPDPGSWENIDRRMFYDIYLLQRQEEGTLTDVDMVRPGLTAGQFSDSVEYHKHCLRIAEVRRNNAGEHATKVCMTCGNEKPINKFQKWGGAKCNACRSKEYRERRNAS